MLRRAGPYWFFVAACAAAIVGLLVHSYLTYQELSRVAAPASVRAMPASQLSRMTSAMMPSAETSVIVAPLDRPRFVASSQAGDLVAPGDEVYLIEAPEHAIVFPVPALASHEVVNMSIGGSPVTVTYCPVTQSVVAFWGTVAGGETSFVPTRMLINGNLVLRDRLTGSAWPQILGVALEGHLTGFTLDTLPVYRTTWFRALRRFPDAIVLSESLRGKNGYAPSAAGQSLAAQELAASRVADNRLGPSVQVLGVSTGDAAAAIPEQAVVVRKCVSFQVGTVPLVAVYDPGLAVVRIFDRRLGGSVVNLDSVTGNIVDRATRSTWDEHGRCTTGALRGVALKPVDSIECLWFAWVSFHPDTEVYR